MRRKLYCVKDSVADCFHMPFQASTDAEAFRMVRAAAMSPDSNLSQFPNDYSLYCVVPVDGFTCSSEAVASASTAFSTFAVVSLI